MSSPVEEIVEKVHVSEGDVVEAGQVLAELLSSQERLEVDRLDVLIEKAEADYKATADLVAERIESQDKLAEAMTALKSLRIEREIAESQVQERIIRSPVSGIVVFRLKDPGEAIGRVEPLFEVINSDQLKLQFFMSAADLPALRVGDEATVQFPIVKPGESYFATLQFIDPQIDSRSGLFRVRYVLDNVESAVKPGARVQVKLDLED
ncbi:hypothetical protein VDG1235_1384 [Verrucomicrobiia bacterium DG1235]|nr:hypothetical protein VDG1235_1384 [Verrucomicrobiae bacterium DG1235]